MNKPRKEKVIFSEIENALNAKDLLKILDDINSSAEKNSARYKKLHKYTKAIQECKIASKAYFHAAGLLINQSSFPELKKTRGNLASLFLSTARRWERQYETLLRKGVEGYREEANVLQKEKRYYEALEKLEKALELDPKNAFLLYDMGVIRINIGDFHSALEQFEKAIQEKPDYEQAYLAKGYVAFDTGQYAIAEDAYSEALKLNESANALNGLGVSLAEGKSDYKQARKLMEKALELEPHSILYKANLAEVMLFLKEYAESQKHASWVRDNTYNKHDGFLMRLLLVLSSYLAGETEKGIKAAEDIIEYSRTISRFDMGTSWDFSKLNEMVKESNLTPEVKETLLSIAHIPKLSENEMEYRLRKIQENIAPKVAPENIPRRIFKKIIPERIISAVEGERIDEEDIQIRNTANPDPDKPGYYDWEIFLDVPEQVLSQIVRVKYILHPTFEKREIPKENRDERFRLERTGWGEFNVKVEITLKDGRTLTKYHPLKLTGFANDTSAERE